MHLLRRAMEAQIALGYRNSARVIAANPIFAGSTRLPADGDLIVCGKDGSGFLIDFKSAKRIEPASMLMVPRQILTFALMDESDEYEIGHVGFYFTRYGVCAHWSLQELLDVGMDRKATGGNTGPKPVDSHRQALRKMLLDLRQPEALNVVLPRR